MPTFGTKGWDVCLRSCLLFPEKGTSFFILHMLYLYITTLKRKGGEFGESTNHYRKVD